MKVARLRKRLCVSLLVAAALAVGWYGISRFLRIEHIGRLVAELASGDTQRVKAAEEEFAHVSDARDIQTLIDMFGDGLPGELNSCVSRALAKVGEPAAPLLVKALGKEGPKYWLWRKMMPRAEERANRMRMCSNNALLGMQSKSVKSLIVGLGSDNSRIRYLSASLLASIKDARAVEPLIAALGKEDIDAAQRAAHALGQIGDRRGVEALTNALDSKDRDLESISAHALGLIGDTSAVSPLVKYVERTHDSSGMIALEMLGTDQARAAVDAAIAPVDLAAVAKDVKGSFQATVGQGAIGPKFDLVLERYGTPELAAELVECGVSEGRVWDWATRKNLIREVEEATESRRKAAGEKAEEGALQAPEEPGTQGKAE